MKQKNLYLFLGIVICICFLINLASAAPLDITFEQDPFPSHAGEQATITFDITNNENVNISNAVFTLDVDDPLTLRSAASKTLSILAGETKTISYTLYVQEDADEGKETITLSYTASGNSYDEDFDFQIASNQVFLQVEQVTTNPESVAPGETITVNIQIKNTANSEVRDVIIGLNLNNMPFAPESITEKRIGSIGEDDTTTVSFDLIVLSTADISVYKIPLTLDYFDTFGKEYQRQDIVSVNVFETPDIDMIIEEDNLVIGMPSNLSIRILNKGLGKINFAEINMPPSSNYDVRTDYIYIGSIESDDYSTVEFVLTPKTKENVVVLNLEYRDMNNKQYNLTKTFNVQAYTVQEAQRNGILPAFPLATVIIILVIIALIIFFILRRRNKKKKLMQNQG